MAGLEGFVRGSGLDPALLHLVRMRASQINGCAYCLDMHSKDARAAGETEQRLYELNAWRETPFAIGFRAVPGSYQPAGAAGPAPIPDPPSGGRSRGAS
jgi:AhpD family alkylhydroperoxidase